MLFLHNRPVKNARRFTGKRRAIDFNLNDVTPTISINFCERMADGSLFEIGDDAFFHTLKASPGEQFLLYTHGFNVTPDKAFQHAQDLQTLFAKMAEEAEDAHEKKQANVVVIPMIWPTDNDFGVIGDYYDDQIAADASAMAFARAFQFFLRFRDSLSADERCLKRINILCHSMGSRVLRGAIAASRKYFLGGDVPLLFRNIFMVAPDVDNNTLEPGKPGEAIPWMTRNLGVYFAADDLAMTASKVGNLRVRRGSKRLGHTGPEKLSALPNNVYVFDCSNFNNSYDHPNGHGYFLDAPGTPGGELGEPGLVFASIYDAVVTGRMVDQTGPHREVILGGDTDLNEPRPQGPRKFRR